MSANCGVCGNLCEEGKSSVKCLGVCENHFHVKCLKVEGVQTRTGGKDFKCTSCAPKKDTSSVTSGKSVTTTITKEFFIHTVEALKKEVFNELKSYSTQFKDFGESVQLLSDAVDKSNNLMVDIRKEFGEMKKENEELRNENKKLQETMNIMQDKVRNLEQYSRRTNLEVSGIPESPNENVFSLIKDVGSAIGQELQESQVMAAHRIPSFRKDRTPSLIVQFQTKMQRDAWISCFKNKKSLTADEVNRAFSKNKVYLNEHLSPDNKVFLGQLKEACRKEDIKYVWFRDGKFYARRDDGERCYKIGSILDLRKIQ